MPAVIECVPNCSEGRDPVIIGQLAKAASSIPGAILADHSADADHNRSVFTIIGTPEAVAEAAFLLAEKACELIDISQHSGIHPRLGAVDVIPFIPLRNVSMLTCVTLAKRVAERISHALCVPVILYEEAAACEERRNLADIRKHYTPEWEPDFGSKPPHRWGDYRRSQDAARCL